MRTCHFLGRSSGSPGGSRAAGGSHGRLRGVHVAPSARCGAGVGHDG